MRHCWEQTGIQEYRRNHLNENVVYKQYICRQCQQKFFAPHRSGKLRASHWMREGIKDCRTEIIRSVQED